MQNLNCGHFKFASLVSSISAVLIGGLSFIIGKNAFFLLLNNDAGKTADVFFEIITYGGDGLVWIPVSLAVVFIMKRKDTLPLLISAFAASTILVQLVKNFILPEQPRPTKQITDPSLVHTITGVDVHTLGSFPSGHTATAFCIYLLFCLLLPKKWWIVVGFLYALFVGYSRVYLAQHFPGDVAGGIIVAIISVYIAVKIQQRFDRNKRQKKHERGLPKSLH